MTGRDIIISAQTGTGKTASFILPTLHRLAQMKTSKNIRTLVLTPTRELAIQVSKSFVSHAAYTQIKVAGSLWWGRYKRTTANSR